MERREIIGNMYLSGLTPTAVARSLKLSAPSVSNVISKKFKSKKIADYIAKKIGRNRIEIFGY